MLAETGLLKKIWILGGGKFGRRAFVQIRRYFPEAAVTVVDNSSEVEEFGNVAIVCEDGINWLVAHLRRDSEVDMIIPAIPVHVVGEWLKRKWFRKYLFSPASLPRSFIEKLPNPIFAGENMVYVSHADFICPDNCAEPASMCSFTGRKRGRDMFRLLREFRVAGTSPLVVRSHQLLPGVGGIHPRDLWGLADRIDLQPGSFYIICTACRCHGVVEGVTIS